MELHGRIDVVRKRFIRPVLPADEGKTDDGYVKTNEAKKNLGNGQTVFGRVDEKRYGYKANDTTNPALTALFYGYDETNASWIVATASSGGAATTHTSSASS